MLNNLRLQMTIAKRHRRFTQWAAQFAVAGELCKKGYEVAFTMGNCTPDADLVVTSPSQGKIFLVDVKGLRNKNPWALKAKKKRLDLYYILALVPDETENQFFILTQQEANALVKQEYKRLYKAGSYKPRGFLFSAAEKYQNKWKKLPQ